MEKLLLVDCWCWWWSGILTLLVEWWCAGVGGGVVYCHCSWWSVDVLVRWWSFETKADLRAHSDVS